MYRIVPPKMDKRLFRLQICSPAATYGADPGTPAETVSPVIPPQEQNEKYANDFTTPTYVLSLMADDTEALFNGEPIILSSPPLMQDNIFYMPLEAVTTALGGSYSFSDDIATISLFGQVTAYEMNATTLTVDGELRSAIDSTATPKIINKTVYVPVKFQPYGCENGFYNIDTRMIDFEQQNIVIIGSATFGNRNELGTKEVRIFDSFDALPEDTKARFTNVETVSRVLNYDIEKHEADGLDVYVMRLDATSSDDVEGMDGRVCAIHLTNGTYSTARGLRVGDSEQRALRLYGMECFTDFYDYKIERGIVESIVFFTRYYGSTLQPHV